MVCFYGMTPAGRGRGRGRGGITVGDGWQVSRRLEQLAQGCACGVEEVKRERRGMQSIALRVDDGEPRYRDDLTHIQGEHERVISLEWAMALGTLDNVGESQCFYLGVALRAALHPWTHPAKFRRERAVQQLGAPIIG